MSKSSNKLRVAVVGGGISALSAAYRLLDAHSDCLDLQVLSREKYEKTCTYSAGGIWFPLGNFGAEAEKNFSRIRGWFTDTAGYYEKLIASGQNSERGVRQLFAVQIVEKDQEILGIRSVYDGIYPLHKKLTTEELAKMYPHVNMSNVSYGNLVRLFGSNPDQYLTWLEKSIEQLGGTIRYGVNVESLSSLKKDYDVIINATGIDATELAGDDKMVSIKGQCMFVKAPWITSALYMSHAIIIPTGDGTVLLGCTYDRNNRDPHLEQPVKKSIMETCQTLVPSLKNAPFIRDAIGLRPFRIGGPRVELEHLSDDVIVIHNYGHGPEGYGLHWGTSGEVLRLFTEWKKNAGH